MPSNFLNIYCSISLMEQKSAELKKLFDEKRYSEIIDIIQSKISEKDKSKGKIYWSPISSSTANISSGIYIVQLISEGITSSSKIMFIK